MSVRIVPADPALVYATLGGEQSSVIFRAVAGYEGDTLLGIGGYYLHGPRVVMFANLTPGARRRPIALYRAARALVKEARAHAADGAVIAVADPSIDAVPNWLRHLGFAPSADHQQIYHLGRPSWNT